MPALAPAKFEPGKFVSACSRFHSLNLPPPNISNPKVLLRVGGNETEKYKVVADTPGYVNAVFTGWIEPTLSSIMIDKVTSYVVWSRTEPADPSRDVPHHVTVFLACSRAGPARWKAENRADHWSMAFRAVILLRIDLMIFGIGGAHEIRIRNKNSVCFCLSVAACRLSHGTRWRVGGGGVGS
jgi:hypothetical protein